MGCGLMRAWEEPIIRDLGSAENVDEAFSAVMDRICEESGLSRRGPWEMHTEAESDVDERVITLRIELRIRPRELSAALPVH